LVPSWADDPAAGVATGPTAPSGGAPNPDESGQPAPLGQPAAPRTPPRPDTSGAGGLGSARSAFSRFARTGSRGSLGSALSNYVRNGTGGARRAARRMGASRSAGARLLGIVRDVQRLGAAETLRQLNLLGLAGRPAEEVFVALLEFVCPPGGALDEAIARQAMLEAIGDLAEAGVGNFDTTTPDQMQEFFFDFITRSIEERVITDLGQRGVTLPDDVAAVEHAQQQLHDFVAGCTRGELSRRLDDLNRLGDRETKRVVDEIYEAAFELVAAAAEAVL
jgi:hypothetical protein